MSKFIFVGYGFDDTLREARFSYRFSGGDIFVEKIIFDKHNGSYDKSAFERALFLAFILVGISYYKTQPVRDVEFQVDGIDEWQATFLNKVYQEGLGQFAFENNVTRAELAQFFATQQIKNKPLSDYVGAGIVSLQSGGKDSLLTASLLEINQHEFTSLYITNSHTYPKVIDQLPGDIAVARREIDLEGLMRTQGLNGHVPVTYIVMAIGLLQMILLNKSTLLTSIGHEGEEPHGWIADLPVNHQWSKTWVAERLFADYVHRYISADMQVGSGLRGQSELRVAELFVHHAWEKFGHSFSSCNVGNYKQGTGNEKLTWCGECAKCANSFLLFAPFVDAEELKVIFNGEDLFEKLSLADTFKGLLGINDAMKPFECVGEVDELRLAYQKAQERGGYSVLPFEVPSSSFDYMQTYPSQNVNALLGLNRE